MAQPSKKQRFQKAEQKLLKVLHQSAALEAELQLMLPPKIFEALKLLAEQRLKADRYGQESRDQIARLSLALRQESYMRFGHDTLETFAFGKLLLKQSEFWKPPPPRLDSISHIRLYKRKDDRLSADQEECAHHITSIWAAFGRFLSIGVRGMEGGGSRGRVIQPIEVMGEELWTHHKTIYVPWYNAAKMVGVHQDRRRHSPAKISLAAIVFKILQDDFFPEEIDNSYALPAGTALRCLKAALDGYYSPERLQAFGKPPETANSTGKETGASPKRASGGQG